MRGNSTDQNRSNLFLPLLREFINSEPQLVTLANNVPLIELETEFSSLYSYTGTQGKPVRLMAGFLILKQLYNLGDETLMPEWI